MNKENKLTKQEANNFKEAIKELNESIPETEKDLKDAKECLEYMSLNYVDENIEKKIVSILKFYTKDVKELLKNAKSEKEYYEKYLKEHE